MKNMQYKFKLNVLSPIHIGAGTEFKYGPYEYLNSKAKLNGKIVPTIKRINITEYYKKLYDENKEIFLNYSLLNIGET